MSSHRVLPRIEMRDEKKWDFKFDMTWLSVSVKSQRTEVWVMLYRPVEITICFRPNYHLRMGHKLGRPLARCRHYCGTTSMAGLERHISEEKNWSHFFLLVRDAQIRTDSGVIAVCAARSIDKSANTFSSRDFFYCIIWSSSSHRMMFDLSDLLSEKIHFYL